MPQLHSLLAAPCGLRPTDRPPPTLEEDQEDDSEDDWLEDAEAVTGGWAYGIPQAVGSLDATEAAASFAAAPPPATPSDPRTYLRPGDVLNFRGGNNWGHIVMLVTCARGFVAPGVYERPQSKSKHECDAPPELRFQNVPFFIAKVLQSASNLDTIHLKDVLLLLDPRTGLLVSGSAAKPRGIGVLLAEGVRGGPVDVQALLSPFSSRDLDLELFALVVDEITCAPVDQAWSLKTAVRSYLRSANLRKSKYRSREAKARLAAEMSARWRSRPICSSVAPRFWQKYLLKLAARRSLHGGAPALPVLSRSAELEEAFVEDVLRLMPIKDDRVLPAELVRALVRTGFWHLIEEETDVVPSHRHSDGPPSLDPFQLPRPRARTEIPPGRFKNDAGNPVQVGADGFAIYCGRTVGKTKSIGRRLRSSITQSDGVRDGTCGPRGGPQCASCQRLQDRLPFVP